MSCSSYWSSRRLIDRVIGQSVLVGGWSQASSREASVALAPGPPMGSVVACVSVVRHGAGVLAPPMGVGSIRRVPPDREGSTRSITSNMVESMPLARVSMVCVSPGTIGARSNAKPAPGTRRTASCDVRECCTAAPGGFKHGRLACPASDGRVSGARQARAARVPWV